MFGWKGGKVREWKTLLFGKREKRNDGKYNLYKLTIIPLLHNRCKYQICLESRTGVDPGPQSPNNKFVECGRKS